MKCVKCGMMLPDDSEFCQYCGAKIEQESSMSPPSAGSELSPVLSFLANNAVDNVNANSRLAERYTTDSDYGLVPEKPVFTFLVDGAEDYLNGLVSENNEELTWNREGSMPVTGVSGPVDIYVSHKKNGQQYKTLYVSIYGKANSTVIPKGFARKGSIKAAPVGFASENGATRNATAKALIDVKNKPIPEANTTNTSKTETPLQVQQQEMLFEDVPNTIQESIPVLLEKVSLYKDPRTGNLVTQCAFRSLTEKSLLAMLIDVHCTDVWGTPTNSVEGFQYLDLRTTRGMVFGEDKKIPIPNPTTRFVEIVIKKVIFSDRSLAEAGQEKAVLPEQQPLLSFFGSEALTNEYLRETGINAQNTITEGGGYWRCTCGVINSDSDNNCYHCNASKSALLALQNVELISANYEAHQKELQEKAEQERIEKERLAQEAKEKARIEKEEKERKSREAAARRAEELRIKKEQRNKKVKRIRIAAAAVVLSLLAAYAVIWHIIPSIRYNKAETVLRNEQYDDAYEMFLALDAYKDSPEKAKEALYQKGCTLLNSGSYTEAAEEFSRISDYKDSHEKVLFCKNEVAYSDAAALYECGEYAEAAEAFRAISGFSDSEERANAAMYENALCLVEEGNYAEAADVFSGLSGYSDSADKANEYRYLYAQHLLEEGEYRKASEAFHELGTYENSKELEKESKYQLADSHFNRKLYKDAYDIFVLLYGYKDSIDRANESKYHYALQLLNGKHYEDAIKAFQQISWYQDAGERLQEAKYNYALYLSTLRPSSNDPDWKKASDIFKELGDYEDSKTKYKETYYEYGLDLLSSLSFKEAIPVFESLGNYEDSKTQVKEAKYRYVFWHKNNTDLTTYEYLKDLKKSGYKDSKDIYKSLYAWKVINIYFNSSENGTDKKYNISKYDPVYCHFELSGGPPGESIFLYHKVIYPAGDNTGKVKPDYKQSRGSTSWWGWADGIYQTPYYGATGTLTFKFYDEEGNLIGEGSVAITD